MFPRASLCSSRTPIFPALGTSLRLDTLDRRTRYSSLFIPVPKHHKTLPTAPDDPQTLGRISEFSLVSAKFETPRDVSRAFFRVEGGASWKKKQCEGIDCREWRREIPGKIEAVMTLSVLIDDFRKGQWFFFRGGPLFPGKVEDFEDSSLT